jgi:hypothetical protein
MTRNLRSFKVLLSSGWISTEPGQRPYKKKMDANPKEEIMDSKGVIKEEKRSWRKELKARREAVLEACLGKMEARTETGQEPR